MNKDTFDYLKKFGNRLLNITAGCRDDMHEPDEQDLDARVVGTKLDNAFCESILAEAIEQGFQEFVVILERHKQIDNGITFKYERTVENFNLATLIALARIGAEYLHTKGQ